MNNLVAKHMNKYNKPATQVDRKKQAKLRPKNKHKKQLNKMW